MAESVQNFIRRVEKITGLPMNRIPDGVFDPTGIVLLAQEYPKSPQRYVASSPHGSLVFTDPVDNGPDVMNEDYRRCLIVDRSDRLPPADEDADGVLPQADDE